MELNIKVQSRQLIGTNKCNKIRKQGNIPAILYGNKKNINLIVNAREFNHILKQEYFFSKIYNLKIDNEEKDLKVIIKDMQRHPVRNDIIQHIDFQEIQDKPTKFIIPFKLLNINKSVAARMQGGNVKELIREFTVICKPKDKPNEITLDVSDMEINSSKSLLDIKLPENVYFYKIKQEDYKFTKVAKGSKK